MRDMSYRLLGVGIDGLRWRIVRDDDGWLAGFTASTSTDNGAPIERTEVREFVTPDAAATYVTLIEDGEAGKGPDDLPLVWLDPLQYAVPEPPHRDPAL